MRGLKRECGENVGKIQPLRLRPFSPATDAPEKQPEENRPAGIHTARISKLVGPPGIVRSINRDIVTHQ